MTTEPHIVDLRDAKSGASARILASLGFNCFSFRAAFDGETIETLWAAADFDEGKGRPSGSGIPLLFPFPGRIDGGAFDYGGKRYALEPTDGRGNAIHGFVHTRPWRVVHHDQRKAIGEFHASVDDPRLLAFWPADFRIRAEYTLHGNTLDAVYTMDNPGPTALPFGFGTHPYFRLPLGGEDAAECTVSLPVSEEWELNDLVPTGMRFPLRDAEVFQRGLPFGEMQFDNAFGGLVFSDDDQCRSTIIDPSSQRQLTMTFDRNFNTCVVYTPGHREAICVEPLTCVPNAIRLDAAGIPAGLKTLQPGQALSARVQLAVH